MPEKCVICCTVLTRKNSEYKSKVCKNCKANIDIDYTEEKEKKK